MQSNIGKKSDKKELSLQGCSIFDKNVKTQELKVDYNAFSSCYPSGKNHIALTPKVGNSISTLIQLKKDYLIAGTYPDKYNKTSICIWNIKSGKLLSELETSGGRITNLLEVEKNTVLIGHHNGYVEFYNFSNPNKPSKLVEVKLSKSNEYIVHSVLVSPGSLAFISREFGGDDEHLKILHFNPKSINNRSISIEYISTFTLTCRGLFSLKNNRVLLCIHNSLYFYDLNLKTKLLPIKIFNLPYVPYSRHIFKLQNEKIITGEFIAQPKQTPRQILIFNIWDPLSNPSNESDRSITLSFDFCKKPFFQLFQKTNGELLITLDSKIFIIDLKQEKGKELVADYDCNVSGLNWCQFIEDGHSLLTYVGKGLDCIRFPLQKMPAHDNTPYKFAF